jgi:hypothetical protein
MGNFQLARPYDIEPVPTALDQYGKVMEMKNVMQRAKINDLALQQGQVGLQQGQMNLQAQQQEQKDMKMYATIYLAIGAGGEPDSAKAESIFLQNGGSPVFAAKMREQHKKAVEAEEDHQRKLTGDKALAYKAKKEKIASVLIPLADMPEGEEKLRAFYQTAESLMSDGTFTDTEFRQVFPEGYPGPVALKMTALKYLEIEKQLEAMKPTVSAAGSVLRDPLSGEVTQIGEKPAPTIPVEQQELTDWLSKPENKGKGASDFHLWKVRTGRTAEKAEADDLDKRLTPAEARDLNVPYGTTRRQAFGKTSEKPLTEAAKLQRATLAEMVQQLDMLEELANKNKSSIGPVDSALGWAASKTTGNVPEVAEMRRISGNLSDMLLRARSGAQINEQEYARLAKLVPLTDQPESNFFSNLTSFRDEISRMLKRRSGEAPLTSTDVSVSRTGTPEGQGAPAVGTLKGGYKFKGGDPSDKQNWVKQ